MSEEKKGVWQWVKKHKVLTVIIVFILLAVLGSFVEEEPKSQVATNNSPTEQNTAPVNTEPSVTTTVKVITNDFENNSIGAKAKYANKLVRVSGKAGSIDEDLFGNPYILIYDITDQYEVNGVQCFVGRNNTETLLSASKGDKVSVQGTISDDFILNVLMNDCSLVQ